MNVMGKVLQYALTGLLIIQITTCRDNQRERREVEPIEEAIKQAKQFRDTLGSSPTGTVLCTYQNQSNCFTCYLPMKSGPAIELVCNCKKDSQLSKCRQVIPKE